MINVTVTMTPSLSSETRGAELGKGQRAENDDCEKIIAFDVNIAN